MTELGDSCMTTGRLQNTLNPLKKKGMISVFPDIIKGVGNTLILSHAVKKNHLHL